MYLQIFEKAIELITPSYNRKKYLERHLRLKSFFEERERIKNLNESEEVKTLLLNSAISALTGAKNVDIKELEYFLDKFNAMEFELLYWTFVWNRAGYQVLKNSRGEIIRLKVSKKGKIKVLVMNLLVLFSMSFAPIMFYFKKDEYWRLFNSLGASQIVTEIIYGVICVICGLTIVKLLNDWVHWKNLNKILDT